MISSKDKAGRLAASIVSFCRFARINGLPIGMQQTFAALEAASAVGISDWRRFSFALRAALCSSRDEWEQFTRIFAAFWNREHSEIGPNGEPPTPNRVMNKSANSFLMNGLNEVGASGKGEGHLVSGASSQQRLRKTDFSDVPQADIGALERLSLYLLRRMSERLSRRLAIETQGERLDLRRSIRRNISHGGDLVALAYKSKKRQKKRLVLFLDISGSMNLYSLFLVRFAYVLQKHFKKVNTFLFSTSVVEVSDVLRAPKLSEALIALSQRAPEWSGGTKIGGSLSEFNRGAGRKILSRNTVFIILSDGWDTGPPEALAFHLRHTRSRVQKLLWLNPLLGLKDYQPITRGMSAALPFVDVFAPGHNLESLLALERYL